MARNNEGVAERIRTRVWHNLWISIDLQVPAQHSHRQNPEYVKSIDFQDNYKTCFLFQIMVIATECRRFNLYTPLTKCLYNLVLFIFVTFILRLLIGCFVLVNTFTALFLTRKIVVAYLLPGEGIFQHGGAVELQSGQGGQGTSQGMSGQAQEAKADPTRLLQAAHQSTATLNTRLEHIVVTDTLKWLDGDILKGDKKILISFQECCDHNL